MSYEVEIKFRVETLSALETAIVDRGGVFGEPVEKIDPFYGHPCRDFARTDEGLRIRRRVGPAVRELLITYKEAKIDFETKTQKEIEIPLESDAGDRWDALLQSLGFIPVATVRKFRRSCSLTFENREFEVVLDFLPDLATSSENEGYFVEIETASEKTQLESARSALLRFADRLPVGKRVRKGYLELILEKPIFRYPPV